MNYIVNFYKGSIFCEDEIARVEVKADSHERALKNTRRKGYLKKDGWKWASIVPMQML